MKGNNNIETYFGKKAFKKVFMEIIDADKILLDLFFDFKAECEVIPQNDNNFKLKFKSSELELDLSNEEAVKIIKKFDPEKLYDKRFDYAQIIGEEHKKGTENEKLKKNLAEPVKNINFASMSGDYQKLFAIQIPVIRGNDKEILTDEEGNNIKLKINVVYTEKKGIKYQLIGQSERIVSELIRKGKLSNNYSELKPLADLLFIDRYCTDKNLEKEITKGELLVTEHIAELSKLSDDVKQEEYKNYYGFEKQLIGLGYTFAEMEELLADIPGRTNTYVGVKDVEVNVTKQLLKDSEIAREIQRLKRAGIHKVVLLKDKDVSNKELYTTILRIRKSGLQPIIGITGDMITSLNEKTDKELFYDFIEESSRFKALAGFRFMVDIN